MELIKIKVKKQSIVSDRQYLVSDTQNVYQVEFEFDDEWVGYQKWAVFKQNGIAYKKLLEDDKCLMPNEAIVDGGYTQIGVYGLKDNKRYPTIWSYPINVQVGCIDGIYPPEPTPSEWEQAIEYMAKIDEVEAVIPTSASSSNLLVDTQTLNDEIERVEGEIPTKISELENDSDFVEDSNYIHTDNNFTNEEKDKVDSALQPSALNPYRTSQDQDVIDDEIKGDIQTLQQDVQDLDDDKVDKVEGYSLSQNNFSNADKSKLDNLENYDDTEIKGDITDLSQRVGANETNIDDIQEVIPSQASEENPLADKSFVNSSIATNTAYFQGTFGAVEDLGLTYEATHLQVETALENVVGIKTNNDYVFVYFTNPTTQLVDRYERYKFTTDDNTWNYEFDLNNSSFTAVQWEAINSGISSLLVAQITNNQNAIAQINTSLTALATRVGNAETNITNIQSAITTLQTNVSLLLANAVRVNEAQLFSDVQKQQARDNIGAISDTNYANSSKAGVLKTGAQLGVNANGYVYANVSTYENYLSSGNTIFIGKGTLEEVITGKNLQSGAQVDTKIANEIGNAIEGEY